MLWFTEGIHCHQKEEEQMSLYAGIDLHANNSYLAVIDDTDELVEAKRQPNDMKSVRRVLEPYARISLASPSSRPSTGTG